MVNRHNVLALLLALVGVMSLISCSTGNKVTSTVLDMESAPGTPQIVTVLQDEY